MQLQEPKARESLLTPTMRRSASRSSLATTDTTTVATAASSSPTLAVPSPSTTTSEKLLPTLPADPFSPLPHVSFATAALMERRTFAIDDAKDEEEEDDTFGIGGDDDDQVMDEVRTECADVLTLLTRFRP